MSAWLAHSLAWRQTARPHPHRRIASRPPIVCSYSPVVDASYLKPSSLSSEGRALLKNLELRKNIQIARLQQIVLQLQRQLLDREITDAVRDLLISRDKLSIAGLLELAVERYYDDNDYDPAHDTLSRRWSSILQQNPDLAEGIRWPEAGWGSIDSAAESLAGLYTRMQRGQHDDDSHHHPGYRILISEEHFSPAESRALQFLAQKLHVDIEVATPVSRILLQQTLEQSLDTSSSSLPQPEQRSSGEWMSPVRYQHEHEEQQQLLQQQQQEEQAASVDGREQALLAMGIQVVKPQLQQQQEQQQEEQRAGVNGRTQQLLSVGISVVCAEPQQQQQQQQHGGGVSCHAQELFSIGIPASGGISQPQQQQQQQQELVMVAQPCCNGPERKELPKRKRNPKRKTKL